MSPPIFQVCAADPAVTAVLGSGPTRLFPFGEAPQGVELPYAVWQIITGYPENHLDDPPDIDQFTIQIDVYAAGVTEAREAMQAIRDAIEPHATVTNWNGERTDPDTGHRSVGMDADWFVHR